MPPINKSDDAIQSSLVNVLYTLAIVKTSALRVNICEYQGENLNERKILSIDFYYPIRFNLSCEEI
jgi:hypothetical protein